MGNRRRHLAYVAPLLAAGAYGLGLEEEALPLTVARWDNATHRRLQNPGARNRIQCTVGWGQYNDDNIRLHIDKEWTRVCFYCWRGAAPRKH